MNCRPNIQGLLIQPPYSEQKPHPTLWCNLRVLLNFLSSHQSHFTQFVRCFCTRYFIKSYIISPYPAPRKRLLRENMCKFCYHSQLKGTPMNTLWKVMVVLKSSHFVILKHLKFILKYDNLLFSLHIIPAIPLHPQSFSTICNLRKSSTSLSWLHLSNPASPVV